MNKRMMIGALVVAGVLGLAGIGLYFNPEGVADQVYKADRRFASPGAKTEIGHEGHGGALPAVPPSAAETPSAEPPTVEITIDKQQMIGMKSVAVAVRSLHRAIRTVGRVEYDERRFRTVNTRIEGWIEHLYGDYTGRPVKKGEPLADIYSLELLSMQREFLQHLKRSRELGSGGGSGTDKSITCDAEAMVAAAREKLKFWDISDEQIRRIEKTGEPIRTLTLYSPIDGHIVQKMAVQGMRAMPGEKLFDLADLSSLWVIADIYEADLPSIRPGQEAVITPAGYPDQAYRSRIDFIYPALAGDTRTARVRFAIPNPAGKLKPQMFAEVEIKIDLGKKLTVPDDAVIDTGIRQVVYVDKGDGNYEPRAVQLGARTEGFREVLRGLKEGEKVASSAAFLVDSEAQLRGVKPLEGQIGR